jgi:hypothetical protein
VAFLSLPRLITSSAAEESKLPALYLESRPQGIRIYQRKDLRLRLGRSLLLGASRAYIRERRPKGARHLVNSKDKHVTTRVLGHFIQMDTMVKFRALAARGTASSCLTYIGPPVAGHYEEIFSRITYHKLGI